MEANPKYTRHKINVLGLLSWKAKDEQCTEQLWETVVHVPGASRRHVQREGNSDYVSNENDEMNLKRLVRYLKGASSAKSLIEIITPSMFLNVYTDSDWAGQATTCKSTSGGVVQWRNATLTTLSRTQQTVSLSSAEGELYALTTGVVEGMVTKHLVQELGHEVIIMNHIDDKSSKAWASKRGLGRIKHVMLRYMNVQDVMEKKLANLAYISTKQNKADLMTKCHTSEAHKTGCAMIGLRLA